MKHKCELNEKVQPVSEHHWYRKIKLISADNPLGLEYFRSDASIREEQNRQLLVNKYAIHPFSKLNAWYQIYLMYLYGSLLITKPVDSGFLQVTTRSHSHDYEFYTIFTDFLSWIDIGYNFFLGYEVERKKMIELRAKFIARQYILHSYFVLDVLSAMPKGILWRLNLGRWRLIVIGMVSLLNLFKVVRIVSFIRCIQKTAEYFSITSKGMLFLLCSGIVSFLAVHWLACMQFAVPKLATKTLSPVFYNTSWFHAGEPGETLYDESIGIQYIHCFFKSSAYVLGIRISIYQMAEPNEYILAVCTYFIGKIIIAFIWIILAVCILNSRFMDIKYAEAINQLQEYLSQKKVPINVRKKIEQCFRFKYQNKYLNEDLITSLLSETLKKEAKMHVCKNLVENVSLFQNLSTAEVSNVVEYLIPQIFLPNDIIIHAGTNGDAMYFVSSGTVAVYTHSGKEVCHLQDGAYFGEIGLVLKGQLRLTTVVALETSLIYRLKKSDFKKYFLTNKVAKRKILSDAEARFKETTKIEEEYQKQLFEESFRKIAPTLKK